MRRVVLITHNVVARNVIRHVALQLAQVCFPRGRVENVPEVKHEGANRIKHRGEGREEGAADCRGNSRDGADNSFTGLNNRADNRLADIADPTKQTQPPHERLDPAVGGDLNEARERVAREARVRLDGAVDARGRDS